ncbi:hypothetical protein Rruber_05192 (plasmid) [Rhodococcus ruber]|uniref:DUF3263 domain-containing protein n=1 Tax=Rhodococcus ruber TaxID=1830 RepID=UPI00315CC8EE
MNDIHSTQITAAPASGRRGESRAATPPGSDKQMVAFAHRWMPYGGTADDEILVEFGLTPTQFYLRVIEILEKRDVPGTLRPAHTRFVEYCNRRVREHLATGRR